MFKNLLQFWKGKDFLNQVLEEFKDMLDDTQIMFESVCKRLINNQSEENPEGKIYDLDKRVNALEKNIRKRVIEHLSIQPSVDVSTCLLLMSVVKDAERLGDYAKNLLEINKTLAAPINKTTYQRIFNSIDEEITAMFIQTKKAFIESDEENAAKSWKYEREIAKRCDQIISTLAKSDLSINEAVCFTLMARYFKRLAAHLTNIATSVILPLSDLDYFDERRRESK